MVRGQTFAPRETGYLTVSSRDAFLIKQVRGKDGQIYPLISQFSNTLNYSLDYTRDTCSSTTILYKDASRGEGAKSKFV